MASHGQLLVLLVHTSHNNVENEMVVVPHSTIIDYEQLDSENYTNVDNFELQFIEASSYNNSESTYLVLIK